VALVWLRNKREAHTAKTKTLSGPETARVAKFLRFDRKKMKTSPKPVAQRCRWSIA
jgi:hypothetical protein